MQILNITIIQYAKSKKRKTYNHKTIELKNTKSLRLRYKYTSQNIQIEKNILSKSFLPIGVHFTSNQKNTTHITDTCKNVKQKI